MAYNEFLCLHASLVHNSFVLLDSDQTAFHKKSDTPPNLVLTYPKFAFKVESIQQFDNVMVVARGQNVNLNHVIFQFILSLCVDNLSSSKGPILLVLRLKATLTLQW